MRIAIVSQGPSWRRFLKTEVRDRALQDMFAATRDQTYAGIYDTVIGVNSIACRIPVDWWCFSDWSAFQRYVDGDNTLKHHCGPVIGTPRISTKGSRRRQLGEYDKDHGTKLVESFDRFELTPYEDFGLPKTRTNGKRRMTFSGPAALCLAWYLCRQSDDTDNRVDCFGCDMGQSNEAIHGTRGNRNDKRWDRERFTWVHVVDAMKAEGIEVINHTDAPTLTVREVQPSGPRRFLYHNAHGPVTQVFEFDSEQAFRAVLVQWFGADKGNALKIEEVKD